MTAVGTRSDFGQNAMAIEFGKLLSPTPQSAKQMADLILGDASMMMNSPLLIVKESGPNIYRNMDQIEAHLDHVATTNPELAAATRAEIMARFSPAEQGELLRRQDGIMKMGPDSRGFNYAEPGKGMSQEAWIANAKATGHPDYARYVQLAGSEDMGAVKKAMDDVFAGRAVMPPAASDGNGWKDPAGVVRAQNGQDVMKGVGIAHDVLVDSAEKSLNISTKSPKIQQLTFAPVKLAFASVDAKLKYNELTARGFSHEAAWSGVAAGQAVTQTLTFGGARVGVFLGGLATSPTGPGLLAGSAVGGVAGGAIGGLIDWAFEVSDQAALAAANAYDGKNIQ